MDAKVVCDEFFCFTIKQAELLDEPGIGVIAELVPFIGDADGLGLDDGGVVEREELVLS